MLKFIPLLVSLSFASDALSFPRLSARRYEALEASSSSALTKGNWVGVLVYRMNLEKMAYRCMKHKSVERCYDKQNVENRAPVEWEGMEKFLAEKGIHFRKNGELDSKASLLNLIVKAAIDRQEAKVLLRSFNL